MKAKNRNQRKVKNIIVSKGGQFKLAFFNLFYLVLIAVVIVLAILSPLYYGMAGALEPCDLYLSAKFFRVVLERMGVAIVVITVLSFVHSILLSHKIFGPLVNIRHTIDKIAKGDFTRRIHLRKGDYLMDEAQRINTMMENLSDSIEALREDHDKMIQMMEKETRGADKDSETGLRLHRIKQYADRCQNHLALFKLRS